MAPATDRKTQEVWTRLRRAAGLSGRKMYWVAAQLGIVSDALRGKVQELPGYAPLTGEEKTEIAKLVESTVADIWGEEVVAV